MTSTSAVPVTPAAGIDPAIEHAITEALGGLMENMRMHASELAKSHGGYGGEPHPKAWFADPWSLLDSVGMGYRAAPATITMDTLRMMSERDTITAAIHVTRINQAAAFAQPQRNKYSVGHRIVPRGGDLQRRLRPSEKERADDIGRFIMQTGVDNNPGRDDFETFLRKSVRDTLTYDALGWERTKTYGGGLHSVYVLPADTLRIAHPKTDKGTPPDLADIKRTIKYVQLVNARIETEFTQDELAYLVRNPRTHLRVYGYGFPESEILVNTVTAHLWAEEWNRRAFSQGSTTKGVLNLKGPIRPDQFEAFKRQWTAQIAGVSNAWKTPVTNTDGLEWIPLQLSNTEMGYQMWMEYLVKVTTAIYQIDPAEINFDLRGSAAGSQPVFMSTNEAQQKVSKDRGLAPLLRFLQNAINRHIVWAIDPRFEFIFAGMDAKTEEQAIELRTKQGSTIYTVNELRALEDLEPIKGGDVILNPTFTGALQQQAMQDAQQQGGAPGPGGQPSAGGAQQPPSAGGEGAPQQPYANAFRGKPGEAEAQGAKAIHGFGDKGKESETSSPEKGSHESSSKKELSYLHIDDWQSTQRSSLSLGDLTKSDDNVLIYDLVDTES